RALMHAAFARLTKPVTGEAHEAAFAHIRAFIERSVFFFKDTATTEIYTLSLHDALPISLRADREQPELHVAARHLVGERRDDACTGSTEGMPDRDRAPHHVDDLGVDLPT